MAKNQWMGALLVFSQFYMVAVAFTGAGILITGYTRLDRLKWEWA